MKNLKIKTKKKGKKTNFQINVCIRLNKGENRFGCRVRERAQNASGKRCRNKISTRVSKLLIFANFLCFLVLFFFLLVANL
jgi:hypothetical protein